MHHDPKTGKTVKKGTVSTPVDEDQVEHELDEALAETFPPATPSPSIPSRKRTSPGRPGAEGQFSRQRSGRARPAAQEK